MGRGHAPQPYLETFLLSKQKKISRFHPLPTLTVQNLARIGCFYESVRIVEPCRSKSSGPKLAHLAVQKLVQFHRSRVNPSGTVQGFVRAQICLYPCKRGLSLQCPSSARTTRHLLKFLSFHQCYTI